MTLTGPVGAPVRPLRIGRHENAPVGEVVRHPVTGGWLFRFTPAQAWRVLTPDRLHPRTAQTLAEWEREAAA
jgi:hypothetical protein